MSSTIEEKLKTFEELSAHFEQFEKELEGGLKNIQTQLTELNSSGQWQDVHYGTFKDSLMSHFSGGILFTKNDAKSAREFLENKHATLTTHKN